MFTDAFSMALFPAQRMEFPLCVIAYMVFQIGLASWLVTIGYFLFCFNNVRSCWCFFLLLGFLVGLTPMVIILASFLIISCVCHANSNLCNSSLNTCEHSSVVYSSFRNTLEWEKNAFWARICFPSQFTAIPVIFFSFFFTLYVFTCRLSSGPF